MERQLYPFFNFLEANCRESSEHSFKNYLSLSPSDVIRPVFWLNSLERILRGFH